MVTVIVVGTGVGLGLGLGLGLGVGVGVGVDRVGVGVGVVRVGVGIGVGAVFVGVGLGFADVGVTPGGVAVGEGVAPEAATVAVEVFAEEGAFVAGTLLPPQALNIMRRATILMPHHARRRGIYLMFILQNISSHHL